MPVPLIQEPDSDRWNTDAGDMLPSSTLDSAWATAQLAVSKTSLGIAGDFWLKNKFDQVEGQKTLSIEELDQKYPGVNWDRPQKDIVASIIHSEHQKENMWANRAALGEGAISGATNLATGLLVGMGDPAMQVGGRLVGAGLKAGGILAGEGLAPSLMRGAVEGAAVMAPLEGADVMRNRAYERDVSLGESLHNIAIGGAFGAGMEGLGFAARELPGFVKGLFPKGSKMESEMNAREAEAAGAQINDGKRPITEPFRDVAARERSGDGPIPAAATNLHYEHTPVDTSQPVTKQYFLGTQSQAEQLHEAALGDHRNASTNFGTGLYGSDKLTAENGYATSSFNEGGAKGLIHPFETQQAKLFDTEKPLDQGSAGLLAGELQRLEEPQLAKDLGSGDINLRQAYDHLSEEKANALNQKLSEMGYDGLHYTEGGPESPRNGVMMFPDKAENVKAGTPITSDSSIKAGMTPEELDAVAKEYASKENDLFHSAERDQIADDNKAHVEENLNTDLKDAAEEDLKQSQELLKQASEKGFLKPNEQAILDEMSGKGKEGGMDLKAKESLGKGLLKEMANCLVEH